MMVAHAALANIGLSSHPTACAGPNADVTGDALNEAAPCLGLPKQAAPESSLLDCLRALARSSKGEPLLEEAVRVVLAVLLLTAGRRRRRKRTEGGCLHGACPRSAPSTRVPSMALSCSTLRRHRNAKESGDDASWSFNPLHTSSPDVHQNLRPNPSWFRSLAWNIT
eukprot:COSAG06_NODE_7945_length_2327_cov_1.926391_2_plen_167_part_00